MHAGAVGHAVDSYHAAVGADVFREHLGNHESAHADRKRDGVVGWREDFHLVAEPLNLLRSRVRGHDAFQRDAVSLLHRLVRQRLQRNHKCVDL